MAGYSGRSRRFDNSPSGRLHFLPPAYSYAAPYAAGLRLAAAAIRQAVARPKGFEPLTPRFVVWCSIQLSYGRVRGGPYEGLPGLAIG